VSKYRGTCHNEINEVIKKAENIDKTILFEEKQLKRLTDLLLKELISEEEYKSKKQELKYIILKLKDQRDNINTKGKEVLDFTLEAFEFSSKARQSFIN
jgi:hypothetical protein